MTSLPKSLLVAILVAYLALAVGAVVTQIQNSHRVEEVQKANRVLTFISHRNCQTNLALRSVIFGMAVNQEDLSPAVLNVFIGVLNSLPEECPK